MKPEHVGREENVEMTYATNENTNKRQQSFMEREHELSQLAIASAPKLIHWPYGVSYTY